MGGKILGKMKDREGKFVTVRIQSGEEEEIRKSLFLLFFFFWQHADDDFSGALVIVHSRTRYAF